MSAEEYNVINVLVKDRFSMLVVSCQKPCVMERASCLRPYECGHLKSYGRSSCSVFLVPLNDSEETRDYRVRREGSYSCHCDRITKI